MPRLMTPDPHAIAAAALALREGKLVVFPTETVYGLGAHAEDARAVKAIFEAKGRPADNPVIIHVADAAMARSLASVWPSVADKLAKQFWPGPLALVVRRNERIPDAATGGLDTVAVRVPDHRVALALIKECGFGIAAPSANKSGRPSPTRCSDAHEDLGDSVAVYLDGGPTRIGVESTVLDLTGETPTLLRPGGISKEAIEAVIGPLAAPQKTDRPLSPGMKYRHYAPQTPLEIAATTEDVQARFKVANPGTAWLVSTESKLQGPTVHVVASRNEPVLWARRIFALLRDLDKEHHALLVVEAIPENGVGAAVMNRLRKAAEG